LASEHDWSKLKALLKVLGARTVLKLGNAVTRAAETTTQSDAAGRFRQCGYAALPG